MTRPWMPTLAILGAVAALTASSWLVREWSLRSETASATIPAEQRQRVEQLQRELERNPENAQALLELANLYYDLSRFADAVPLYRRYLERDPGNAEVRIDYAYSLFASGQEDAGIAELYRVLERFPDHPIALYNLGILYAQRGELERARQPLSELIRLHPSLPIAQRARQALQMLDSLSRPTTAQ
jgi:tetratricopeptide (TPR) repeat protein